MCSAFIYICAQNFNLMNIAILTCAEMPDMLPYDIEVVKQLKEKGVETSVFIWDELLKFTPDVLKNYDYVLIRSIWDYYRKVEKFNKLLDFLDASGISVLNPIDIVRWNMDKKYLLELHNEGYSIIPTIFNFGEDTDSFKIAVSKGWKKMILKPMISAGSYHTFVIEPDEKERFNKLIDNYYINRPYMLQEFIPEISQGEISTITLTNPVNQKNGEFSYSVTKVPKKGDYRVQINYGGEYSIGEVDPIIKNISKQITKRFGNKLLYQRLDGLWRNGKFLIMEIELIEPDLYLNHSKDALNYWVNTLCKLVTEK